MSTAPPAWAVTAPPACAARPLAARSESAVPASAVRLVSARIWIADDPCSENAPPATAVSDAPLLRLVPGRALQRQRIRRVDDDPLADEGHESTGALETDPGVRDREAVEAVRARERPRRPLLAGVALRPLLAGWTRIALRPWIALSGPQALEALRVPADRDVAGLARGAAALAPDQVERAVRRLEARVDDVAAECRVRGASGDRRGRRALRRARTPRRAGAAVLSPFLPLATGLVSRVKLSHPGMHVNRRDGRPRRRSRTENQGLSLRRGPSRHGRCDGSGTILYAHGRRSRARDTMPAGGSAADGAERV